MMLLVESRKRLKISRNELKALREDNFLKLYKHAIRESPYYNKVFKGFLVENIEDLSKVPILTKELLKREYLNIICKRDENFLIPDSTSGSTGEATLFGVDTRSIVKRDVDGIRSNEMNGQYSYLDKMLTFWGAERDIVNKKNIRYFYNYFIKKMKTISTYHMKDKDIEAYLLLLNKYKPKLIVGYPSALNYMADYIVSNKKKINYKPDAIISAGEMLYDVQRENIEKYFGSSVFNRYGCREVGHIATECCVHKGLHYDADRLIIEVVDNNGNICPPNTLGNILITDLNNYSFPLIRYKIGDIGSLSDSTNCECGCTLPKINEIEGRSFDVIKGVNGNSISGSFWTLTFRHQVNGIDNFQVRQKAINEIELRIKVKDSFNNVQKNKIIELVKAKLGKQMLVEILIVDHFEYSPTGKFKWIVSDLN